MQSPSQTALKLPCRGRDLDLSVPRLMGVVNVTPDSFSDGGEFLDSQAALAHAELLIDDGADLLDVGGESTRPGAKGVSAQEETDRILPVIEGLVASSSGADNPRAIVSVDTSKPEVAEAALAAGARIVNDVSGLPNEMLEVVARHGATGIAMHMQGSPQTMQSQPNYQDVVDEVANFLSGRLKAAKDNGVPCVVDPGIGFGKTLEHNLALLSHLGVLLSLGAPVLVGASRKSFISALSPSAPHQRLPGTLAAHLKAIDQGAHILRVHDVREHLQALAVTAALYRHSGPTNCQEPSAATDIYLDDREVSCRIGVPPEERESPQALFVSLRLELDPRSANTSDELRTTVDYAALSALVGHVAQSQPWKLVESLAHRLAQDILVNFPATRVSVTIHKPVAAQALRAGRVGCSLTLTRRTPIAAKPIDSAVRDP